jgi:ArsR family transcriptional regulator|tara:strand:- start:9354 stop:9689 length:336 start_codon:yes stop_codon:yes gene_type:complete
MERDSEQLARELWTIGDDNRLRLLAMLPTEPGCENHRNVSELAAELGLSQPTVSNHLARLRTLGIVKCRKMCRDVHYWIDQEMAAEIITALAISLKTSDVLQKSEAVETGK